MTIFQSVAGFVKVGGRPLDIRFCENFDKHKIRYYRAQLSQTVLTRSHFYSEDWKVPNDTHWKRVLVQFASENCSSIFWVLHCMFLTMKKPVDDVLVSCKLMQQPTAIVQSKHYSWLKEWARTAADMLFENKGRYIAYGSRVQNMQQAASWWQGRGAIAPPKFWAVGKLSENFLLLA